MAGFSEKVIEVIFPLHSNDAGILLLGFSSHFHVFLFLPQSRFFLMPGLRMCGGRSQFGFEEQAYFWGHAFAAIVFVYILGLGTSCLQSQTFLEKMDNSALLSYG